MSKGGFDKLKPQVNHERFGGQLGSRENLVGAAVRVPAGNSIPRLQQISRSL